MKTYTVVVGNIGTVHTVNNYANACKEFSEYRDQSRLGYGRAAYEPVTLYEDGEPKLEHFPKLRVPSIKDLASLITAIKLDICDEYRERDDEEPNIMLTIGCAYDKDWSYQTGDNSYSGGAYGHPYWGVGYVTRRCNARGLAREIIEDCQSQVY